MDFTGLIPLIPQGASVAAVIMVVIIFLNFIDTQSKLLATTHKTCEDKLERITEKNESVIMDNTKALTQLVEVVKEWKRTSV